MLFGLRFLPQIIEKFSSFFRLLIFSSVGFSSVPALSFPTLGSFEFGTDEETERPMQVPELQRTVSA